jgi:hypothetical protein
MPAPQLVMMGIMIVLQTIQIAVSAAQMGLNEQRQIENVSYPQPICYVRDSVLFIINGFPKDVTQYEFTRIPEDEEQRVARILNVIASLFSVIPKSLNTADEVAKAFTFVRKIVVLFGKVKHVIKESSPTYFAALELIFDEFHRRHPVVTNVSTVFGLWNVGSGFVLTADGVGGDGKGWAYCNKKHKLSLEHWRTVNRYDHCTPFVLKCPAVVFLSMPYTTYKLDRCLSRHNGKGVDCKRAPDSHQMGAKKGMYWCKKMLFNYINIWLVTFFFLMFFLHTFTYILYHTDTGYCWEEWEWKHYYADKFFPDVELPDTRFGDCVNIRSIPFNEYMWGDTNGDLLTKGGTEAANTRFIIF